MDIDYFYLFIPVCCDTCSSSTNQLQVEVIQREK